MEHLRSIYLGADSLLTTLGNKEETLSALAEGKSGLHYNDTYKMCVGAINRSHPLSTMTKAYTFFESLIINQLKTIFSQSTLSPEDSDLLVILSTTKGNIELLTLATTPPPSGVYLWESASKIAHHFGLSNQPLVISNACISGVSAMIVGREMILAGKYKHAIIVGCDVLSPFITEGFASFKSISREPCRPYDEKRDGLTLGEACGAILLTCEQQFAQKPVVSLVGGAITNDANHISGPSRTGDGLFHAIDNALKEARLSAEEIGFINTHGTATLYNDEMESKAIDWALLNDTPLNSLKGYFGHTLGASGVVESIISAQELREKQVYGTSGFETLGTSCKVKVSADTQSIHHQSCIKTASGFGGCNAAISLTMRTINQETRSSQRTIREGACYELPQSDRPFAQFIRTQYKELGESNLKFYKMSDLCKAAYVSIANLLKGSDLRDQIATQNTAIILSNRSSSLETDIEHQLILNEHNPAGASPAIFVYTLPNVAIGEICIRHKIRGYNTFFIEDQYTDLTEKYAYLLLETNKADIVIYGWCEKLGEHWKVELKSLTT